MAIWSACTQELELAITAAGNSADQPNHGRVNERGQVTRTSRASTFKISEGAQVSVTHLLLEQSAVQVHKYYILG